VLALSVLLSVSVSLFSYFATVALFLLLLTAVVVVRYNVTRIVVNLSAMSQQAQILRRARIDPDLTPLAPKVGSPPPASAVRQPSLTRAPVADRPLPEAAEGPRRLLLRLRHL
jgi:hypothetical protein